MDQHRDPQYTPPPLLIPTEGSICHYYSMLDHLILSHRISESPLHGHELMLNAKWF